MGVGVAVLLLLEVLVRYFFHKYVKRVLAIVENHQTGWMFVSVVLEDGSYLFGWVMRNNVYYIINNERSQRNNQCITLSGKLIPVRNIISIQSHGDYKFIIKQEKRESKNERV